MGNIGSDESTEEGSGKGEGEEKITTAVTTSPKPPPKAPTMFARDPGCSGKNLLGGFRREI